MPRPPGDRDWVPIERAIEGLLDDIERPKPSLDEPIVQPLDDLKNARNHVVAKAELGYPATFMCTCGTETHYFHPGFESKIPPDRSGEAPIVCDGCGDKYDAWAQPWEL